MKTTIRILALIALVQTALIVTTWMGGSKLQSHTQGSQLLNFKTAELDSLLIKDNTNEVQLHKKDNKWLLADGFPADQKKVGTLLTKLSNLQYSLPVATSAQALSRFKVEKDNFERYLQLQGNNKTLAELYLGTGAGARNSHIRSGEQDSVYSAAIGSYDLPATADSWQDKEILQLDKADVTAIELGDLKLLRQPEADKKEKSSLWQGASLPSGTTVNQQAVNGGLEKLVSLRFSKILGREEQPKYGLSEPVLTIKLLLKDGDRTYNFGKIKDSEDICLKVSDRKEYFQLTSYHGKGILEQFKKDKMLTDANDTENELTNDNQEE
jgi:hypothetical protein